MSFFLFFLVVGLGVGPDWGFFAHRHINRMAVFTLPPAMMPLFKAHIDYLAEHAVDPDKRRYAVEQEAVRHYIDLDHWGALPFDDLPRTRFGTLLQYGELGMRFPDGDTLPLVDPARIHPARRDSFLEVGQGSFRSRAAYSRFLLEQVLPAMRVDSLSVACDSLRAFFRFSGPCGDLVFRDAFAEHGILPYHLWRMQRQLTEAFRLRDRDRILKLAAEQGHYLADAHVPLHTTENYNGQLSGQEGIHAFWESRIPELFAATEFDFLVGKAQYLEDPPAFFREVVLESHRLSARVLAAHLAVRDSFPSAQQWCYEPRGAQIVRQPCRAFARAYQRRLRGMVEQRMRQAIHAVGSSWYTAWVDGGQPKLWRLDESPGDSTVLDTLEYLLRLDRQAKEAPRPHEGG